VLHTAGFYKKKNFILIIKPISCFIHAGVIMLGTLITADNNISGEINNRITLANRIYFGMVNMLKSEHIYRDHKVTTYETLIKQVLMYGAETWVLSKADELRLGVFERKY
jgi:hypothetical protein